MVPSPPFGIFRRAVTAPAGGGGVELHRLHEPEVLYSQQVVLPVLFRIISVLICHWIAVTTIAFSSQSGRDLQTTKLETDGGSFEGRDPI